MCASLVMAQTAKKAMPAIDNGEVPAKKVAEAVAPTDYKASIFTKDDDVVIRTFTFAATDMAGIGYGSSYKVVAGDVINGETIAANDAHTFSEANSYWTRIESVDSIPEVSNGQIVAGTGSVSFVTTYPTTCLYGASQGRMGVYMGTQNGIEEDNGFMFMSLIEYHSSTETGHAYFTLPAVTIPEGTPIVDVNWRQYYRKFYDNAYVDYKLNGAWYSIEVNVTNIDVNVNGTGSGYYSATLPPTAANQDSLELRFRWKGVGAGHSTPGYMWAIDNVVVSSPSNSARWDFHSMAYLDGFYGTMPQGFNIPMSYVMYGRNRGMDNLTGVQLSVEHILGENVDTVLTRDQVNMPAGNPMSNNYILKVNERGFMSDTVGFDDDHAFYHAHPYYYGASYDATDAQLAAANFTRVGLPTATAGLNQFTINMENAQGLTAAFDTVAYTVSDLRDADEAMGLIEGYRWAHDNGVIPGQSEFAYQFTDDGYVSWDGGRQYERDYGVRVRFNSPNVIPLDENGDPWVLRGVEYVTATNLTADDVTGARLTPEIFVMHLDDSGTGYYYYVNTGLANDEIVEVPHTAAPTDPTENYGVLTPEAPYYAVNVLFPEQPEILPNTSYFIGYSKADNGTFSVAEIQSSYAQDASTSVSYRNDPDVAVYANQFWSTYKVYDVIAYDPLEDRSITGWNIDEYPMIRLIVGPKMDIPSYEVYLECPEEEGEYWIYRNGYNYCNYRDTAKENSSVTYFFFPGTEEEMEAWNEAEDGYFTISEDDGTIGHMVIDAIYDNGVSIDINDTNKVNVNDYYVYWEGHTPADGQENEWAPAQSRKYYGYTVRNIHEDHTVSAHASYHELGIGEIEDYINMTIAPNPATSQVSIKVAGFNGKADCSIIDMSGRVVYSSTINAGETVINLNSIPAGAYFVRVTNNTFSKVEKLIVR